MIQKKPLITYTFTDEAPALATISLYPILSKVLSSFDIDCELKSISLADRVLALFRDHLPENKEMFDGLDHLTNLVHDPDCQIIKLPNISASLSQLKECIAELKAKGHNLPDYPENPKDDKEVILQNLYQSALGSAVNPKLRVGNSHRHIPPSVKAFAAKNPHPMGSWDANSKTTVHTMDSGDFFGTERCAKISGDRPIDIVFFPKNSSKKVVLASNIMVYDGDLIDSACLSKAALSKAVADAKKLASDKGIIFSLHLKATMMKGVGSGYFWLCPPGFFCPIFLKSITTSLPSLPSTPVRV